MTSYVCHRCDVQGFGLACWLCGSTEVRRPSVPWTQAEQSGRSLEKLDSILGEAA